MNLQEVAIKYKISDNALGSRDDGLVVAAKSVKEIIAELERTKRSPETVQKLWRLHDFLLDVKSTSF